MFVTERCGGCRKTGGWHGNLAAGVAPVFHHVYAARKAAVPDVKRAEFALANGKANAAADFAAQRGPRWREHENTCQTRCEPEGDACRIPHACWCAAYEEVSA